METDLDILAEYVEESRAHLEHAEKIFVEIKKTGETSPDAINDLFRAIHTIKGSAGYLELTNISTLTHAMESLLDDLREGALVMNPDISEALIEGVDMLNNMFDDVSKSAEFDVNALVDVLKRLRQTPPATDNAPAAGKNAETAATSAEGAAGVTPQPAPAEPSPVANDDEVKEAEEAGAAEEVGAPPAAEDAPSPATPPTRAAERDPAPQAVHQVAQPSTSVSDVTKHEEFLRIRVDILDRLMMLAGELVLVRNQQLMHMDQADPTLRGITTSLNAVTTELQETIMRTRMQPIGTVFSRFSRMVRDLSRKLGKDIEFVTEGDDVELDKNMLEAIADPLTHLIRNACDHGVETPAERAAAGKADAGRVTLSAYHESGQIHVDIQDNGRGMSRETIRKKVLEKKLKTESELSHVSDQELLDMIFLPGFSTATVVTEVSGRGVGMDVVKTGVEKFGGSVSISSTEGSGSIVKLRLPLTLAIIPSLIVQSGDERFAIPQVNLEELVCLYDEDVLTRIECADVREVFRLRECLLPMVRLREALARVEVFDDAALSSVTGMNAEARKELAAKMKEAEAAGHPLHVSLNFAVLRAGNIRFGLIIDRIIGSEEIVVKPMHRAVKDIALYSGTTVLGDGKVAMILDAMGLARHYNVRDVSGGPEEKKVAAGSESGELRSLLLFSNGGSEQFGISMQDVKRVEAVETSKIERIGSQEYLTLDGVSTRVVRLEDGLGLQSCSQPENMFLLIPQTSRKPYGLLVEKLIDSGHYEVRLNHDSYRAAGVEGTVLIKNKMTVLVNLEQLVNMIDCMWYGEQTA
ncbi:MAG: chemotaxis protein CheW [Acidobacteriota bacterium]|nr:chemotaxis protein CheW [Acidobacteriota bacterium]